MAVASVKVGDCEFVPILIESGNFGHTLPMVFLLALLVQDTNGIFWPRRFRNVVSGGKSMLAARDVRGLAWLCDAEGGIR